MAYQNVVVAGGGVLGTQIALQAAYWGCDVTIWLRSEGSIGRTQPKIEQFHKAHLDAIEDMAADRDWSLGLAAADDFDRDACIERANAAAANVKLELDLAKAVADADVVIESMAEDAKAKTEFYKKLAPLMPEKTVLLTNSSSLLPSKFAASTGRPNKYLAMHFANTIWKNNVAEVMAQPKTDMRYFNEVIAFAEQIHMLPLPVKKEKAGYLLNSMLIPLLFSGMDLYVNGISDPQSIDTAWVRGTGAPKGPFQILDTVGLTTAENIVQNYLKVPSFLAPYNFKGMDKMLKAMIAEGKLGKSAGEGFYKYE